MKVSTGPAQIKKCAENHPCQHRSFQDKDGSGKKSGRIKHSQSLGFKVLNSLRNNLLKLLFTRPMRNKSPIHLESLASSLLPFTALTHFGLAVTTRIPHFQNRDPVLSGGFHADIQTVILIEPVGEAVQIRVECGKAFLLITGLQAVFRGFNDGSHQK